MTRAMTRVVRLTAAIVAVSVVAVVIAAGHRLPTPARSVSTFPLSHGASPRRAVQARAGSEHRVHPRAGARSPARAVPDRSRTRAEGREVSELGEHRPRRAHDRPLPHRARADLGRDRRSGHEAAARLHGGRARRLSARERQRLRRRRFPAAASCGTRSRPARSTSSDSPSTANGCPGTTCTSCSPACAMRISSAASDQARTVLVQLADWAERLASKLSDAQMQEMLGAEHGGMNEVLADVSAITDDRNYLTLAQRFSHRALLDASGAARRHAHRPAREHADSEGHRLRADRGARRRSSRHGRREVLLADRRPASHRRLRRQQRARALQSRPTTSRR